ncbi:MAG: hypothetical protein KAT58_00785 [candidate division Zixibacteria bacterium]|nr:hypothetical protein [candidate division Zixibacteria bacterium]
MSKRSNSRTSIRTYLTLAVAVFALSLMLATVSLQAASVVRVTLERAMHADLGDTIEVPITLENDSMDFSLSGFDLFILYDTVGMTFMDAVAGSLLTECEWEYFNVADDPSGLIRLVGVGDIIGGSHYPTCFLEGTSGTLATLSFAVTCDPAFMCYIFPYRFYWADCGDNSFATLNGDTLLVSREVWDWDETPIQEDDTFPTIKGVPDSCLIGGSPGKAPVRMVDYRDGHVDIICADSIDARGDIDLNGVAYQIADWVLFANYFLAGLSAFSIDQSLQTYVTDTNDDDVYLTVRDFVYLQRVIIGDALPYPKPGDSLPQDTAVFIQDMAAHTVSLDYPDSLAAAFMIFSGEIFPEFVGTDLVAAYDTLIIPRRILLLSATLEKYSFGAGLVLTYTGEGQLLTVEVADYENQLIHSRIEQVGGEPLCGDADGNGVVNIGDVAYLIAYIFAAGSAPTAAADVDCDNMVNISDVVYLISFIFAAGPAPCSGCPW